MKATSHIETTMYDIPSSSNVASVSLLSLLLGQGCGGSWRFTIVSGICISADKETAVMLFFLTILHCTSK